MYVAALFTTCSPGRYAAKSHRQKERIQEMQTEILNVEGMSCGACVGHVTRALQSLAGVQSAEVSLQDKKAVVIYDAAQIQAAQMIEAVAEEGYEASRANH